MAPWRLLWGHHEGWSTIVWMAVGPSRKRGCDSVASIGPSWRTGWGFSLAGWSFGQPGQGRGGARVRPLVNHRGEGGIFGWQPLGEQRQRGGVLWQRRWGEAAGGGAVWCFRACLCGYCARFLSGTPRSDPGNMNEAEGLRQRRPIRPQVITEDNTAQESKGGRCVRA